MLTMEKFWLRRLFSRPEHVKCEETAATADYGNAEVQFRMGIKFAGDGPGQDYAKAAEWYGKAAAQQHALAQFNLGIMCANGQGMARDASKSMGWLTEAANLGDAGAQHHLGKAFHRASCAGSPQAVLESRIEAYKWYHLAAAQGYVGAAAGGEAVVRSMTRQDVVVGEQRVAEFELAHPRAVQD